MLVVVSLTTLNRVRLCSFAIGFGFRVFLFQRQLGYAIEGFFETAGEALKRRSQLVKIVFYAVLALLYNAYFVYAVWYGADRKANGLVAEDFDYWYVALSLPLSKRRG